MTIAIDFIGTNLGSGAKTYNINFCNELHSLNLSEDIKIFICESYIKQIHGAINNKNKKIQYIIKPNFLSFALIKMLWMQIILPLELKFLGVKKLYSPLNFSPMIAKLLNIKTILCLHSNLPWVYFDLMPGNIIRNFITKKFMEISIFNCDLLIVDSFFAKNEIIKNLKLKNKKIEVVYLSISNNFISNKKKQKLISGFNYKSKYILSVMSCVRYHNIINLIKAHQRLIKQLDFKISMVLVLQVLDKDYFSEIERYIKSNFANDEILIFPNLESNQLPNLYKNAECYVFTSYCEVFGLTSLEAMSQKTPVIISNRSALPEINGDAAIYFDPDKIDQIQNSLKKILIDKTLKQKLINNGNVQLKKFNGKNNIQKTINIINGYTNNKIIYRPRVLCFISHYLPGYRSGGPSKSVFNLINHLGNNFEFFIITSDRDVLDKKPYSSVKINSWNKIGTSQVYYVPKSKLTLTFIAKIIHSTKHDILYLNSFFDFTFTALPLIARRLMFSLTAPCILAPRGEFSNAALNLKFWKKKLYITLTSMFRLYKGLNWQASGKKEFNDILITRQVEKKYIKIAADLPTKINNLKQINFKKNIKKTGMLNAIFLSRITPMKNLDFLLKVLRKTKKLVRLSIYGPIDDNNYWLQCKNLIKTMPKNVIIVYNGSVSPNDVYATISKYDIMLLPSLSESYGHVIAESLMVGTPVIISNKTPWDKSSSGAIITLPPVNESLWLRQIEKWVDYDQDYSLKRSLAAKKIAKLHLFNKKDAIQNKNFFLRFIN